MTKTKEKKSVLGKGLAALISEKEIKNENNSYIPNLPIEWITPNPHQPRLPIKPEDIIELSKSIKDFGVLEPLLVKRLSPKNFTLIAGERRMRAAQMANLKTIPVMVMEETSPLQMLQIAMIENIHRKDLSPLEEAVAYERLSKDHSLSHADIAKTLGIRRTTITNKIRLLKLPQEVKELLLSGEITEGHGRALLGLENDQSMITAAKTIIKQGLSVRATEALVRKVTRINKSGKSKGGRPGKDFYKTEYDYNTERFLSNRVKTDVKIERYANSGGKVVLKYKDQKQLEELVKFFTE